MRMRRIDIVVVVGILVVLGIVGYPIMQRSLGLDSESHARFRCLNNLRQMALAHKVWAQDHDNYFPFQISTNAGGTREYVQAEFVYRHFAVISNELADPKVLICPADPARKAAREFSSLGNQNLSYFLNIKAIYMGPYGILAGDRNVELSPGGKTPPVKWGPDMHKGEGNICFTDGSARRFNPVSQTDTDMFFANYFLMVVPP